MNIIAVNILSVFHGVLRRHILKSYARTLTGGRGMFVKACLYTSSDRYILRCTIKKRERESERERGIMPKRTVELAAGGLHASRVRTIPFLKRWVNTFLLFKKSCETCSKK
jgi:hypothetical protein